MLHRGSYRSALVLLNQLNVFWKDITSADPEGGTGGLDTPGKSQVIWVSIGNKQLDPPPPLEKVGPPGKCWTPSGTLKNDRFLWKLTI